MYITVFLLTLYFVFLMYSLIPPLSSKTQSGEEMLEGLTILVPFFNESDHLPHLIQSLAKAEFTFPVEFLFVDDHSDDDSVSIVQQFGQAQLVSSIVKGKKHAINQGVKYAKYSWILTLDADVQISTEFVSVLQNLKLDGAKLFLFSLMPIRRKGWIAAFFDLEFIALQAIGINRAQKGQPLLANGACLLFEREAFAKVERTRSDYHISSGDDIFGMFAIANQFGNKAVKVASVLPLVSVSFPLGLKALFLQRTRWISKTIDVPDMKYVAVAFLIGIIHLIPLGTFVALIYGITWPAVVLLLGVKFTAEWIFFALVAKWYRRRDLLLFLPLVQLLYPIYTFALIFSGVYQKLQFKKRQLHAAG